MDDAALGRRHRPDDQPGPVADRQARAGRVARPDGKYVSYFSDKSGEYQLVIEAQDGLGAPRVITLEKPTHYYTASWSPDSKKLLYTDTNLNVWVMDVETGKAKIVGRDPWMVRS